MADVDLLRQIEAASAIRSIRVKADWKRRVQKEQVLRPGTVAIVDPRSEEERYREVAAALDPSAGVVDRHSDPTQVQD